MLKWIILLIVAGSYGKIWAYTYYLDTANCPIDNEEVIFFVMMGYSTTGSTYDFEEQGWGRAPYEYQVESCSKCGYSGYQWDFDTTHNASISSQILEILEKYSPIKRTEVTENRIAAEIGVVLGKDNSLIGHTYLVASYFLRDLIEQDVERIALQKLSIDYYLKAIENDEFDDREYRTSILYLIGDLYRRTAQFDKAIQYYDKAASEKKRFRADWIDEVIENQRKLAVNRNDNNSI
ncbi:DUF2225 domain-containing protein [Crocinitomix catalasitica]|nr:DUF2225 domain-containing protein [Crocinitomix catalasitica]